MATPEKIMKEAIEKASMEALKESGISPTYIAEVASSHFGDGLKIDVMALSMANEIRKSMHIPEKTIFDGDGISEETVAEYLRRIQG